MAQYAMIFDQARCIGCNACVVACQQSYGVPAANQLNWVRLRERGEYPIVRLDFRQFLCGQCDDAPCLPSCPVPDATYRRDDGVVMVDDDLCIGCRACIPACPYGARSYNDDTRLVVKCTFCVDQLAQDKPPFCVSTCPTEARIFVNLDQLTPEQEELLAKAERLEELDSAKPHVYYV